MVLFFIIIKIMGESLGRDFPSKKAPSTPVALTIREYSTQYRTVRQYMQFSLCCRHNGASHRSPRTTRGRDIHHLYRAGIGSSYGIHAFGHLAKWVVIVKFTPYLAPDLIPFPRVPDLFSHRVLDGVNPNNLVRTPRGVGSGVGSGVFETSILQ